jgi:hypothetical protein
MNDIEFHEEKFSPSAQFEVKNPTSVQMLIDWGLAKDAKSANIVLISFAILFFVTSIFFFSKFFNSPNQNNSDSNDPFADELLLP